MKTTVALAFLFCATCFARKPGCQYKPPEYSPKEVAAYAAYAECLVSRKKAATPRLQLTKLQNEIQSIQHKPENSKSVECISVKFPYETKEYCYSVSQMAGPCATLDDFQPFHQARKISCAELKKRFSPDFERLIALDGMRKQAQSQDNQFLLKLESQCRQKHPKGATVADAPCRKWESGKFK